MLIWKYYKTEQKGESDFFFLIRLQLSIKGEIAFIQKIFNLCIHPLAYSDSGIYTFWFFRSVLHSISLPQVSPGEVTSQPIGGQLWSGENLLGTFLHLLLCSFLLSSALRPDLRLQHWKLPWRLHAFHRSHHICSNVYYDPHQVPHQEVRKGRNILVHSRLKTFHIQTYNIFTWFQKIIILKQSKNFRKHCMIFVHISANANI